VLINSGKKKVMNKKDMLSGVLQIPASLNPL